MAAPTVIQASTVGSDGVAANITASEGSTLVAFVMQESSATRMFKMSPIAGRGWYRRGYLNPGQGFHVFEAENVPAGTHAITAIPTSSVTFALIVVEVSGSPRVAFDTISLVDESVNTNSHVSAADTTVIDTAAEVVVITAGCLNSDGGPMTPGAGYTTIYTDNNTRFIQYKSSETALTDEQGVWTHIGSARQNLGCIISLKSAPLLDTLEDPLPLIAQETWEYLTRELATFTPAPPELVGSPVEAGFSGETIWSVTIPSGFTRGNAVIVGATQIQSTPRTLVRASDGRNRFTEVVSRTDGLFAHVHILANTNVWDIEPGSTFSLTWSASSTGRLIIQELTPAELAGLTDSKGEVTAATSFVSGATGLTTAGDVFVFAVGSTYGSGDLTAGGSYTRLGADRSLDQTLFQYRRSVSGLTADQGPYSCSISRQGQGAMAALYSTQPPVNTVLEHVSEAVWEYSSRTLTASLLIVRPDSTEIIGSYTASGAATLHEALNDESDATYIVSTDGGTSRTIELLEGSTVRATRSLAPGSSFATETFTLTAPEVASVTSWSDIRIRITDGGTATVLGFPSLEIPTEDVVIKIKTRIQ